MSKKTLEPTRLAACMSGNGIGNGHLGDELSELSGPIGQRKKSRKSRELREREMEQYWMDKDTTL